MSEQRDGHAMRGNFMMGPAELLLGCCGCVFFLALIAGGGFLIYRMSRRNEEQEL